MSNSRVKRKKDKSDDDFEFIKKVVVSNKISRREIEDISNIDHPLFSFKYLQEVSISGCSDYKFFYEFLFRLKKLSELGWDEIRKSERHSFGMEKIPMNQIKPKPSLPDFVTPDAELSVFRATGTKHPFIGVQQGKIFYIFFIEANFGDIYNH